VREHKAVPRAVHRLHPKLLPLDVEDKHILLVVGSVPGDLPELEIVHIRCDHLLVVALEVLLADEVDELVVDSRAVREPEARARRELVEEEELLRGSDRAVVALLGLLDAKNVLLELLLVRERYAVHALQRVVRRLALPVRCRVLHHRKRLHARGVRYVRPAAEVDEVPALVRRAHRAVWHLRRAARSASAAAGPHHRVVPLFAPPLITHMRKI